MTYPLETCIAEKFEAVVKRGVAIEQSHQGNNSLRALWFGGFLFVLPRKSPLAGVPWVANGFIERARFRRRP